MEGSLLETLKAKQADDVGMETQLRNEMDAAKRAYDKSKFAWEKQKKLVEQNARALKVYEEPKKRTSKAKPQPQVAIATNIEHVKAEN